MNRTRLPQTWSALVVLLALVACVLPGQAPQPAPAGNPVNIETAVAGTAQAAQQLTQQAIPPTATPVPTATITPTPKISNVGTSLMTLADGSTEFSDHTAGIRLVFSPIWLVFRVGEPEYYAAWERPETQNKELLDFFGRLQDHDPKVFRADAVDVRPGHAPGGVVTYINVVLQAGDTRSLKEWDKYLRQHRLPFEGYKYIGSSYTTTPSGIKLLITEERYLAAGNAGTIYYRRALFVLPAGTVHLDLATNFDYKDIVIVEFEQVLNSITLLNP